MLYIFCEFFGKIIVFNWGGLIVRKRIFRRMKKNGKFVSQTYL